MPITPVSGEITSQEINDNLSYLDAEKIGKNKLPYANVLDYGAVGDGDADDTVAIQAAVNSFSSNKGGVVIFPEGSYKVTSTITISNPNITLLTHKTPYLTYGSADYTSIFCDTDIKIFQISNHNITLRNLMIEAKLLTGVDSALDTSSTQALIEVGDGIANYDNFRMYNCMVRGGYYGLKLNAMNAEIIDNLFSSCHRHLYLPFTSSYDCRNRNIQGNSFHSGVKVDSFCIYAESGNYQDRIVDNRFDGSWFQGGIFYNGNRSVISNNVFRYNRGEADIVVGGYGNIVNSNNSTNSYGHGIEVIGNKNIVSNNHIANAQRHGVYTNPFHPNVYVNTNLNIISENIVTNCGLESASYNGVELEMLDGIFSNNIIYGNPNYGVRVIGTSDRISFSGNKIRGNTSGNLTNPSGNTNAITYTGLNDIEGFMNLDAFRAYKTPDFVDKGYYLQSPNGSRYKITVDDTGNIVSSLS